jgi:GNAT superfamily N-acetyltransferase
MSTIQIADTDNQILDTYEVMTELRPNISREEYVERVRLQQREVGFQLAYLADAGGAIVCVAGFRLCRSLGWGRYLYVDDLITRTDRRSSGHGAEMLAWLRDRAKSEGCETLRLDSALERRRAHHFYFAEEMDIHCFHFRQTL